MRMNRKVAMSGNKDLFSAAPQALGYMYQARVALLYLMRLPEETAVLIEKDDDLDFMDKDDLIELSDYMTDLDSSLSVLLLSKLSSQEIAFISNTLQKISALLSSYNETYDISAAIKSLGIVVGENIEECADKSQKLAKLFLGFMEDLQNWRDALFVNGASSVDFLDATLISDALMIANTIKPPETQASDDDEDIFAF
jgi:sulfur relay (sulfurtransferase) DsrC/TusE family protein